VIDKIIKEDKIYAIIIKSDYSKDGIEFFTPDDFSQQLAYMKRPKGYNIKPHIHTTTNKNINNTQEVLLIKSGKVRVDFYDDKKNYFISKLLFKGDVILLAFGGHGFEILEEAEIIEVKQGPYDESKDKTRFENVKEDKIKIS
tara:strand:+ start:175 stop:603 length:429 start_codon:yes stop_codon:yes gene_type:complete